MTPGTILFDPNFRFKDGKVGKKLFVLLSGGSVGDYVVAKMTSRGDRFGFQCGCQAMDRFPNFFLPQHSCCLSGNTWIQLESYYEFEFHELSSRIVDGSIKQIGALGPELTVELLICATHSNDVTGYQSRAIQAALERLQAPKGL